MSKHTPGPWKIGHHEGLPANHVAIDAPLHGELALVVWKFESEKRTPRCEANAQLIAAAPDLLEAWQRLLEYCDESDGSQYGTISTSLIRVLGKDAITKATGEQA